MGCWAEGLLGSWQSCFLTWVLVIGCYLMIIHYAILLFCRSFLLCVFYLHLEVYFLKGVCVVVVQSSSHVQLCTFFNKRYFWVLSSFGILPKCVNVWILFVESGSLLLTLDTPSPAPPHWALPHQWWPSRKGGLLPASAPASFLEQPGVYS